MALAAMLAVQLMFAEPWARPPKIHISDALLDALDSQHGEDARERVEL